MSLFRYEMNLEIIGKFDVGMCCILKIKTRDSQMLSSLKIKELGLYLPKLLARILDIKHT